MNNDSQGERSDEEQVEAGNEEEQVAQENQEQEVQDEDEEKDKKKKQKKHPYEIDYARLPKGKIGRIVYEYNDYDMTWERLTDENQEWLDDEKTHLGEKVDAFFLLLLSITQKYRKEIQKEKHAKINNDQQGKGKFRLWCSDHCHKFVAILIWLPLITSIFLGYFINIIAGVVIFAIFSLIPVIMFMSGCAFHLSHTYADHIDYNYNMEIFASLKRMEREIKKLLPELNKRTFEPLGYKWELSANCRAFILLKNAEYEGDEGIIVPDMPDNGAQWLDGSQGNEDGFRKSQENNDLESQKSDPAI